MNKRTSWRSLWLAALISCTSALPQMANATIVEFRTVLGDFQVNLYDNGTPATVANFLGYRDNGAYTNSVIHRSVPNFVVQGGGFTLDTQTFDISDIVSSAPVVNEPEFSNVSGTIAMAKLGGDPNSATNQWFFNLADNSAGDAALDTQNGGFTVFGEVVGNGMDVVNAIAALPRFDVAGVYGSAFGELPLQGDTTNVPLDTTNFIIVSEIVIIDATVDSAGAAGLTPVPNTLIDAPPVTPPTLGGGGGGGSLGFLALIGLLLGSRLRKA